jgi:hypothetical protein
MGSQIIITIILFLAGGYFYLKESLKIFDKNWHQRHYGEEITPEMLKERENEMFLKTIRIGAVCIGLLLFTIISICMGAMDWD